MNKQLLTEWDIKPESYIRPKGTNQWCKIASVSKSGIFPNRGGFLNFEALASLYEISEDGKTWKGAYHYRSLY